MERQLGLRRSPKRHCRFRFLYLADLVDSSIGFDIFITKLIHSKPAALVGGQA
jgi:hypothetical protein